MTLTQRAATSAATPAFQDALADFAASHFPNGRIAYDAGGCPPVKVERTLMQLLEAHPTLEIDRVHLQGASGCEYFRGVLRVEAGAVRLQVRFHWDCRWRAEQQGWRDAFGFPDQIRAAREFGHDCFRSWEVEQQVLAEPVSVLA